MEQVMIVLSGVLLVCAMTAIFVLMYKESRAAKAGEKTAASTEEPIQETDENGEALPELSAYEATITEKRVETRRAGTHIPVHDVEYWLTFETSEGEKRFKVARDYFDTVNKGDVGTLVLAGGDFFDFGEGEEIAETEEACDQRSVQ